MAAPAGHDPLLPLIRSTKPFPRTATGDRRRVSVSASMLSMASRRPRRGSPSHSYSDWGMTVPTAPRNEPSTSFSMLFFLASQSMSTQSDGSLLDGLVMNMALDLPGHVLLNATKSSRGTVSEQLKSGLVPTTSKSCRETPRKRSAENNFTAPAEGANVVIPSGQWVVLDGDTPALNKLTVVGVLEIPDTADDADADDRDANATADGARRPARALPEYRSVVIDATYISIQVNEGTKVVLQHNIVAGFERVGYRIDGEPCPGSQSSEERWHQNEAHGGLYGVYMNKDGLRGCSLIRGFTVWKSYDYGIYFQTPSNVIVAEVTLADNGLGLMPLVYSPRKAALRVTLTYATSRNRTAQPPQPSTHVPSMVVTPMAAHGSRSKLTKVVPRTLMPSSNGTMTPRASTWPTTVLLDSVAPAASPKPPTAQCRMRLASTPAFSLLATRKPLNCTAPTFTHSAPFSQFHTVRPRKTAGSGVRERQPPRLMGVYSWKIHRPNQPCECTVLLANSPSGTRFWQMLRSYDGPSGCSCMRYQKPKWVPPAAALWRTTLFGLAGALAHEHGQVVLEHVARLDAVLDEEGAAHDVVDDVALHQQAVRVVDGHGAVERLVDGAAAHVRRAVDVPHQVPVDGVAAQPEGLARVEHLVDGSDMRLWFSSGRGAWNMMQPPNWSLPTSSPNLPWKHVWVANSPGTHGDNIDVKKTTRLSQ
ncbi:hypothetical protein CRUP_026236 [Coryphaenoides rupestris]|nr:hypothetical protein CRUP_026236 [Coryphaenoides rupestris]